MKKKSRKNLLLEKPIFKTCKNCGEIIEITKKYGKTRKFCSKKCGWQFVSKKYQKNKKGNPPKWRCYGCGHLNQLNYTLKTPAERLRFDHEICSRCKKSRNETIKGEGLGEWRII